MANHLQARFNEVATSVAGELVGRDGAVQALLTAVIARQNVFLLGPPGSGKTMLVDRLIAHIDTESFRHLMTRFTTESKLFGPISVPDLTAGRDVRNADGYLPTARIAYLDEVWHAGTAVLDSLLEAANERTWTVGGERRPLPLWSMIFTANSTPGGDLAAMWDRVHVRFVVEPITKPRHLRRVLLAGEPGPPAVRVADGDVVQAQAQAAALPVDDAVVDGLVAVIGALRVEGIDTSARRARATLRFIQAAVWLRGRDRAVLDDLRWALDCLWDEPANQPMVGRAIADALTPPKHVYDIGQDLDRVAALIRRHPDGLEAKAAAVEAQRLVSHASKLRAGRDDIPADLEQRIYAVADEVAEHFFHLPAGALPIGAR